MTRPPIKQLTLHQPWASLIALGVKTVETRSWSTPYRGLIAIVAGKAMPCRLGETLNVGGYEVERDRGGLLLRHQSLAWPYRLPTGVVVATAKLVDVVPTEETVASTEVTGGWEYVCGWPAIHPDIRALGDFRPRRFAWLLEDLRRVRWPIEQRGSLGLRDWTPPPGWSYSVTVCAASRPQQIGAAS